MTLQPSSFLLISGVLVLCFSAHAQDPGAATKPASKPVAPAKAPASQPASMPAKDAPKAADPVPTDKVAEKLGADMVSAIAQSERIELVEVERTKGEGTNTILGHPIKGKAIPLNADAAKALRSYLLNADNYVFGARARCRLRPSHGIIFRRGDAQHGVLVNPGKCPKWAFPGKSKRKIIDIRKPAAAVLAALFSKIQGAPSP